MKIQRKHVVLASLVLALGVAVYVNWQMSSTTDEISKKELGKATYVNKNITATIDQQELNLVSDLSREQQNYFSNARLKRSKAYDEVKSIALEALSLVESDEDSKESALAQLAFIEEIIMNQESVENILMAKGFSDCICTVSDNIASVVVPENEMNDKSTLIIKDAVSEICGIGFEDINIITI